MVGIGVVRNNTEWWIAIILIAVGMFVGVEIEAWISRKVFSSDSKSSMPR